MSDFTSVRTNTLRGDYIIPFDLFVSINNKYVHYLKADDIFENDRYIKLKEKRVKKLYIKVEDEDKYRQFLEETLKGVLDSKSNKSIESRAQLISGRQSANVEAVVENPENQAAYQITQESNHIFIEFLNSNPEALQHVLREDNVDQNLSQHSVNVAAISARMAEQLKYPMAQIESISLGGLFHDMGHVGNMELFGKPHDSLSAAQMEIYKQHAANGGNRVKQINHFDSTVVKIISQHEEMLDGSGFPLGLKDKEIHEAALIVGVANLYDRIVSFEKVPPKEAIKEIVTRYVGRYPLEQLQLLQSIVTQKI